MFGLVFTANLLQNAINFQKQPNLVTLLAKDPAQGYQVLAHSILSNLLFFLISNSHTHSDNVSNCDQCHREVIVAKQDSGGVSTQIFQYFIFSTCPGVLNNTITLVLISWGEQISLTNCQLSQVYWHNFYSFLGRPLTNKLNNVFVS